MRAWHQKRSAPLGALLAGAATLCATAVVAAVFYLSVVRTSRGLPAYTAGLRPAALGTPWPYRAVYHAQLRSGVGRVTPAGTPSVAHRWRVTAVAAPDDALCSGAADDEVVAADDSGARRVQIELSDELYIPSPARPVPARVLSVCPEAAMASAPDALEYTEEVVPPGARAEVVACLAMDGDALVACDDGAPSRVYLRSGLAAGRVQVRGAMTEIAGCAAAFASVCFVAALLALRAFDRRTIVG